MAAGTITALGSALGSASQLGSAGGTAKEGPQAYQSGIGSKIFGAPGDPAGTTYGLVAEISSRIADKRRFKKQFGLAKRQVELQEKLGEQELAERQAIMERQRRIRKAFTRGV